MTENRVTVLQPTEEQRKLQKRQEAFYETCEKINRAWAAMGYTGDPIIELCSAIQGMSIWRLRA